MCDMPLTGISIDPFTGSGIWLVFRNAPLMHWDVEMYRTDPQICLRSGDPPMGWVMKGLIQRLRQSRYPLCQNSGVSVLFTDCRIHHADTTDISRAALLVVYLSVGGSHLLTLISRSTQSVSRFVVHPNPRIASSPSSFSIVLPWLSVRIF